MVIANFFTAAAIFPGLLTTRIRTIGIPYDIAVALLGGTAPYLQTWMSTTWGLPSFA